MLLLLKLLLKAKNKARAARLRLERAEHDGGVGQGAAEHAAARGVGVEALDDVLGDERVEQVPALPPRHITLLYDIINVFIINNNVFIIMGMSV